MHVITLSSFYLPIREPLALIMQDHDGYRYGGRNGSKSEKADQQEAEDQKVERDLRYLSKQNCRPRQETSKETKCS